MTVDDVERLNYYERQFLGPSDFVAEQAYHIGMRRRHLIAHHTWGIVVGLELAQDPNSKIWAVQPGLAIDGYGREVVVPAAEPLDTAEIARQLAGVGTPTPLKVWIAYRVERADRPPAGYEICDGPSQFTRVRETYRLIYQDDPPTADQTKPPPPFQRLPDDPWEAPWPLLLGEITWDPAQNSVSAVDARARRYAGLIGATLMPPSVAQNVPPTPPSPLTLTLAADQTNVTGPTTGTAGRLVVSGDVQVNGGTVDWRASGGGEAGAPLRTFRSGAKDLRLQLGDDPASGARLVIGSGSENKVVVQADGSVTVNGTLGVGDSREIDLDGGRLAFRNPDGTETPDVTELTRQTNPATGHQDLRIAIGSPTDPGARLIVGPKQGNNVQEKLVVENDGDVTVGGRLTVQGFSLFHRGADLVISGRTGGNPRALVDDGNRLIVNFASDYAQGVRVQSAVDVQGNLSVQGNVAPSGTVDGRDIGTDGAKLDGISANAKNVAILSGVVFDGGTIPLPPGFTQAQCRWIVSPRDYAPPVFDVNETGASARFRLECSTIGRTVRAKWWQQGHSSTPGFQAHGGWVSYIIVGVK